MKAFIKEPGKAFYSKEIKNDLRELQYIVDGYIEAVTVASDLVILCNEDGIWQGLPFNTRICGHDFVGTLVFVGVNGEEFDNVPLGDEEFAELFGRAVLE